MNEILNQDEIDALLKGVDEGAVVVTGDQAASVPAQVTPFNLASQGSLDRHGLPTLDMINERVARQLRIDLGNMLRRAPQLTQLPLQLQRYSDYLQGLQLPASLNLVRISPLRGTALCVLDPALVHALVDGFFGGSGRHAVSAAREFTRTENRVVQKLLASLYAALKTAWAAVLPIEILALRTENNPDFAGIAAPTEQVLISAFQIEVDGLGGHLQLVLPYASIEPLRAQLGGTAQPERPAPDAGWVQSLRDEIEDAEVELVPVVGRASLTVGRLVDLQPGDVIPCEFDGNVTVFAEGVPLLRGTYGVSRGQQAIKIASRLSTRRGA